MARQSFRRLHVFKNFLLSVRYSGVGFHCLDRTHAMSSDAAPAVASCTSNAPSAREQFSWLSRLAPKFPVAAENVEVLREPSHFYNTLKAEVQKARHRIVIASLYLGTGKLEQELVDCVHEAARHATASNKQLDITILLDCNRGSRGVHNSRTMLLPLLKEFPGSVRVCLYHTPDMRGLLRRALPERWNEVVGLNHIKVYLFDDNLIMSGANLSDSYFTKRQDRYIMLRQCGRLADFFSRLVHTVGSLSFQLQANDTLKLPSDLHCHPYQDADGGVEYREEARRRLEDVLEPSQYDMPVHSEMPKSLDCLDSNLHPTSSESDTWVFPLVQTGPFNITQDDQVTSAFFRKVPAGSTVHLASGYFNLTDHNMGVILEESQANYNILTAAPEANGFYRGQGISGAVPQAYTYIAQQFYNQVLRSSQQHRIQVSEFSRSGWTFHAKGLWCYLPGDNLPSLTFIGSPNFGYRSVYRDLEAQIVLVTDNHKLQQKLHQEKVSLYSRSQSVTSDTFTTPERRVPFWVTLVTPIIKNFF